MADERQRMQLIAELLGQFERAGMLNSRTQSAQQLAEDFEGVFETAPDLQMDSIINAQAQPVAPPIEVLMGQVPAGVPPALIEMVKRLAAEQQRQQQLEQLGIQSFSFPGNLDRRVAPFGSQR